MKKNTLVILIIAMICVMLYGYSCTSNAINTTVESFYSGSQMVSKVALVLNEKIIDFEAGDASIVVYFGNDIVFRNNAELKNQKSMSSTLEFKDLDTDKVKQFIGTVFDFSEEFLEKETQIIDEIFEAYMNNENFKTTYDGDTIKMTVKTTDGKKRLTIQIFS